MVDIQAAAETKFKETDVGPLPVDWIVRSISEIANISGGGTPSTKVEMYWDGDIPWLTPSDVTAFFRLHIDHSRRYISHAGLENSSAKLMPAGTVLMTSRATIGEVVICDVPMATNQGFINIVADPKTLHNEYLAYWIHWRKDQLRELGKGTTFLEISKGVFKSVSLPLPPLPEQRRIAAVLNTIHDAIAAQEDVIAEARALKRSLMQRLFTYGPGREPAETRETEIGPLPENWRLAPLKSLGNVRYGKARPGSEGDIPVVGSSGIYAWCDDILVNSPTIIVGRKGSAGQVWYITEPCWISDTAFYLEKASDEVVLPFLASYLSLSDLSGEHARTTMPSLQRQDLESLLVPLPPIQAQEAIAAQLAACEEKIASEVDRGAALQDLFKSARQQLMTGQIRLLSDEGLPLRSYLGARSQRLRAKSVFSA
ncbi:MAG TPA: restriction endonuclease subunit S [Bellilinea sp.]|nr:restriction endonuclease subunit S [Bellilinea sp.]